MAEHSILLRLIFLTISLCISTNAHNITHILEPFPEYSLYSSYLSQTKLADEINSRQTLTCLVLPNPAMSALAAHLPLSAVKDALSLLTLLDYYDPQKLHDISNGTTLSTTLFQASGEAPGNLGFVNITDLRGGTVAFASAAPGSPLASTFTKPVKQIPYNISVLEISAPIVAPGLLSAPAPSASDVNLTAVLDKAGCTTFAALLASSGVLKTFQAAMHKGGGLTVFAPSDEAFKAPGLPDLAKLATADLVALLQYHAVAAYSPLGSLKTSTAPISTLASSAAGKFDLKATAAGDSVTLSTGVDSSRVASTVIDDTPVCIFTVDGVLFPVELFGASPSPAPAPVPVSSPSPSVSPAPAPVEKAPPHSKRRSPPAPPESSPEVSPAGPPSSSAAAADINSSSAVASAKAPALLKIQAMVTAVFVATAFSAMR